MDSIVLNNDFDISNVKFDTKMKALDTGCKMKFVSYKKGPLVIQTPECYTPYGINNNSFDEENSNKYTLDLSFRDVETRPALKTFFENIQKLDELIITEAFKNQKDWFRKSFPSVEIIRDGLYKSMIKYAKDKNTGEITDMYPPTFKVKIPFANDKFGCEFYDKDCNSLSNEEITCMNSKGAKVIALIRCNGLWFAGGQFGVSWKAVQLQITPRPLKLDECMIKTCKETNIDDDDVSDEECDESDFM